ncbi:MAG: radical SAM protein [Candidatus Bathyarchaeia archaeon]
MEGSYMASTPSFVIWLVTSRCNIHCSYCYTSDLRGEFDHEEAIKTAEGLVELASRSVGITGGEPLLWPPLRDVLKILRDGGLEVSIQSNMKLFDIGYAKLFSDLGIFLFTSLDGADKLVHEAYRGIGSWDAVVRGLKIAYDMGLEFATVTTISDVNVDKLPSILEFSCNLGSRYAAFIPIIPVGRASRVYSLLPDPGRLFSALTSLRDKAYSLGFHTSIWCTPFAMRIGSGRYFRIGACTIASSMDILPDGSIPICDTLRIGVSDVSIGVVKAWSEYISHPLVKKISKRIPDRCRDCSISSRCRGGCIARAYATTGLLDEVDPLCPRIAIDNLRYV